VIPLAGSEWERRLDAFQDDCTRDVIRGVIALVIVFLASVRFRPTPLRAPYSSISK
jgi:hypothetical protein